MRNLGNPSSMALAMPPLSAISAISFSASAIISAVMASTTSLPAQGSTAAVYPASVWSNSWVLRAMRADMSVGNAMASSSELVCNDCVPPMVADKASIAVRATLFQGSWAVNDQPDVWVWVRSIWPFALAPNSPLIRSAQSTRPARILAISFRWAMPLAQKKLRRGAKASTSRPASTPVFTYSKPSAKVYANSISCVAPASCMWYPLMLMELKRGMCSAV